MSGSQPPILSALINAAASLSEVNSNNKNRKRTTTNGNRDYLIF